MTKLIIALSKLLKRRAGHRKHFGYHAEFSGHL